MKDRQGFLQATLALFMAIAAVTGLSLWGLLHHWKALVDHQLRLDKCTGTVALDLESDLGELKSSNAAILAFRASIAAAMAVPGAQETVPPLQLSLHLVYIAQEAVRLKWDLKEIRWVTQSCGTNRDFAMPFTPLSWDRPAPDEIGENQIDLKSIPNEFRFEAFHLPRRSAAVVERTEGDESANRGWKAHWAKAIGETFGS